MMPQNNQQPQDVGKSIQQIKEFIAKHSSGIIVLPSKPSPDAIAAATSLYLAFMKFGKNVSLAATAVPQVDFVGVDKIKTGLDTGGDNLIVSFPYIDGAIDKVDYHIQGDRFNLVIVPREGHTKLETNDVKFSYTGGKIDFIIVIDAPNLNSLGELYQKNQRQFETSTIINIDRHLINNSYGMINLVSKTSSSTSELILKLIQELKIEVDKDMATNLYAGIVAATNNLTAYSVNAETYDAVATLLRAGAVKKPVTPFGAGQMGRAPGMMSPMGAPMGQFGPRQPFMNDFEDDDMSFGPSPMMNPMPYPQPQQSMQPQPYSFPSPYQQPQQQMMQPQPIRRQPQPIQQPLQQGSFAPQSQNQSVPVSEKQTKSLDAVEVGPVAKEGTDFNSENALKPKIFSGSGGLV